MGSPSPTPATPAAEPIAKSSLGEEARRDANEGLVPERRRGDLWRLGKGQRNCQIQNQGVKACSWRYLGWGMEFCFITFG